MKKGQCGICLFCGESGELQKSHIIPKFLFRWLKQTGTGKLRNLATINRRVEDGPTRKMLCSTCEEKFGKYESYFNREIFQPFVAGERTVFDYDERLAQFVLSVFWRLLEAGEIIEDAKTKDKSILLEAKNRISEFLQHGVAMEFEIQMLAGVDLYKHDPTVQLPDGAIYYMARGIDFSTLSGQGKLYLYLKLPKFMFILPLKGLETSEYSNSRIFENGGRFDVESTRISDQVFADFVWETFRVVGQLKSTLTKHQLELSKKVGQENWNELQSKDLGIILEYQKMKSDLD